GASSHNPDLHRLLGPMLSAAIAGSLAQYAPECPVDLVGITASTICRASRVVDGNSPLDDHLLLPTSAASQLWRRLRVSRGPCPSCRGRSSRRRRSTSR